MVLFYSTVILLVIDHDIIKQTSGGTAVREECNDLDFGISNAMFYREDMENLFVFIMLADLVLFGELFQSHRIMLDPIYWTIKMVWTWTHRVTAAVIAMIAATALFGGFALLFLKYDIGLF